MLCGEGIEGDNVSKEHIVTTFRAERFRGLGTALAVDNTDSRYFLIIFIGAIGS
jgi:hypothetical protein